MVGSFAFTPRMNPSRVRLEASQGQYFLAILSPLFCPMPKQINLYGEMLLVSKTTARHCSSCLCVLCSRRCTWSVSTSSLVRSMKISVLPPTTWTSPTSREWITRWDSWRTEEIWTAVNVLYLVFNYGVSYKLPASYNKCFTWYLNVAENQGCLLLVCK